MPRSYQRIPQIHNLIYFMHIHMSHTLNRANNPIKQSITTRSGKQCGLQQISLKPEALAQVRGVLSLKLQTLAYARSRQRPWEVLRTLAEARPSRLSEATPRSKVRLLVWAKSAATC